jgi:hypothetical protein
LDGGVALASGAEVGVDEIGVDEIGSAEHTAITRAVPAPKLAIRRHARCRSERNCPVSAYILYGSQIADWNFQLRLYTTAPDGMIKWPFIEVVRNRWFDEAPVRCQIALRLNPR